MTAPDIAVVIVTFRSAHLCVEALGSLAQEKLESHVRLRAIVVDNASGDLPIVSEAVADNRWADWITLVQAPRNGGFAYGNNLGLRYAYSKGDPDYVYLLNPDTRVQPGAVATLVHFLDSNPHIGIAGGSFENDDGSEWPIAFRFPSLLGEISQGISIRSVSYLLRRWEVPRTMGKTNEQVDWISGASMLIRGSVFVRIGGLDEHYFLYFEETDFCLRALRAGFPTWYVPESRVMHIAGQSTQLMERRAGSKRLPAYWFESRRRYFVLALGIQNAIAVDLVAILAFSVGVLKCFVLGRRRSLVPHFVRDLIRHSVLWPKNRTIPTRRLLLPSEFGRAVSNRC